MDQIQQLVAEVAGKSPKKIMLQLPAGLKMKAAEIVESLKKQGIETIVANNPCYGACDLADAEAKQMNCNLLVHVGHNKFYVDFPSEVPVLYFPWFIDIRINGIDLSKIKEKRIGLLTTIQHTTLLNDVKEKLDKNGFEAVIGGQVLGCWTFNADKIEDKVDAYLYVGSGKFHPLAVKNKKIYSLDMEKMQIEHVDPMVIEKRRYANIYNAKDAKTFAILVTTKKGQNQLLGPAEEIKEKVEKHQKSAFIVVMNEINDSALLGIKADAFINTACPRIVEDFFSKPIINTGDIDAALGD
ncbi:MAG: diphthamide biosynthesis enzyme Dph2 [Candidatus Aenigmarchaeota archaeon]|nr:diphthamide biosynthesis enzyme Dph2 [Candidatus Aenigmarchaeota archaeon]